MSRAVLASLCSNSGAGRTLRATLGRPELFDLLGVRNWGSKSDPRIYACNFITQKAGARKLETKSTQVVPEQPGIVTPCLIRNWGSSVTVSEGHCLGVSVDQCGSPFTSPLVNPRVCCRVLWVSCPTGEGWSTSSFMTSG